MGAWFVVLVLVSAFLHVGVSVKLVRVFLGIVTSFWRTFVLGGGGGSVAIPGNTCPSGPLCVLSSHCVWATVSGVIRCWGDSVVGCSRAARAPPAAYQGTGQSGFRPQRE